MMCKRTCQWSLDKMLAPPIKQGAGVSWVQSHINEWVVSTYWRKKNWCTKSLGQSNSIYSQQVDASCGTNLCACGDAGLDGQVENTWYIHS